MSDDAFSWGDMRKGWSDASDEERVEREAWLVPPMERIQGIIEQMAAYRWFPWYDMNNRPKERETVAVWSPGSFPHRAYWEKDDRRWWAICDGDIWPMTPPLMFRRLEEGE